MVAMLASARCCMYMMMHVYLVNKDSVRSTGMPRCSSRFNFLKRVQNLRTERCFGHFGEYLEAKGRFILINYIFRSQCECSRLFF